RYPIKITQKSSTEKELPGEDGREESSREKEDLKQEKSVELGPDIALVNLIEEKISINETNKPQIGNGQNEREINTDKCKSLIYYQRSTDDNKDGETSIDTKNKGMRNNMERYMNNATIPRKESSSNNYQHKTHNEKNGVLENGVEEFNNVVKIENEDPSEPEKYEQSTLNLACKVWTKRVDEFKRKIKIPCELKDSERREIADVEVNFNNKETLGKDYKRPTGLNPEKEEK
ncbi:21487_t:CDS:2, partial [Gigaspora margarita]